MRTRGTFHISRNEYEKCSRYGDEWCVVQVEFSIESLVAEQINSDHVAAIRELPAAEVLSLIPPDSKEFCWEASARLTPPPLAWRESEVGVPSDLRLASFDALGREVLARRSRDAALGGGGPRLPG